jgi:hypothetical protein
MLLDLVEHAGFAERVLGADQPFDDSGVEPVECPDLGYAVE